MNDSVDKILKQWQETCPGLDCSAMGVIGRLGKVHDQWSKQLDTVFALHHLSRIEFDILATLRRNQIPLTPTELYQTLMLSSGAMSTRIEKLVQRGLIERLASEQDRRSCKVALTREGTTLLERVLNEHLANMGNMLAVLNNEERSQLSHILKKVLLASEMSSSN